MTIYFFNFKNYTATVMATVKMYSALIVYVHFSLESVYYTYNFHSR